MIKVSIPPPKVILAALKEDEKKKEECKHDFEPRFRGNKCLDTCKHCGLDRVW